jgi:hypothetical protein
VAVSVTLLRRVSDRFLRAFPRSSGGPEALPGEDVLGLDSKQFQVPAAGVCDDRPGLGGQAVKTVGTRSGGNFGCDLGQPGPKPLGRFTVGNARQDTVLA